MTVMFRSNDDDYDVANYNHVMRLIEYFYNSWMWRPTVFY